jgi:hypothetical protein
MKVVTDANADERELLRFLHENMEKFEPGNAGFHPAGCFSGGFTFPDVDLLPSDYLGFAQDELGDDSDKARINCIGHVKRAVDGEMARLLQALGLQEVATKRRMGFDGKLKVAASVGAFSSRSLAKLNVIRNKVEHDFSIVVIDDLEVYYELAQAFVYAVEGCIAMLASCASVEFSTHLKKVTVSLQAELKPEDSSASFYVQKGRWCRRLEFDISSSLEGYTFGIRTFLTFARTRHLIDFRAAAKAFGEELKLYE